MAKGQPRQKKGVYCMDEAVKNTEAEEKEALTQEEATESLEATEVEEKDERTSEEAKKEKTFTQAQVNEIVQARLDRERKKWERKDDKDEVDEETKAEQEEKASTNQEELDSLRIENIALRKGVSEKHLGYLKSLANAHEGEYSERIDKVLEDFPFLKEEKEVPKVVRASVSKSQNPPKAMTKAEIMEIKDPKARRQAIKDNQILFQN